jgi:hypothetical protein
MSKSGRPGKPTLGYASRTDAVLALRAAGKSYAQISALTGMSENSAKVLKWRAGKAAPRADGMVRTITIAADVLLALRPEALKRHMRSDQLVRRLLDAIVADALVPAILDVGSNEP